MKTINIISTPLSYPVIERAKSLINELSKHNKLNVIYLVSDQGDKDLLATGTKENITYHKITEPEYDRNNFVTRLINEIKFGFWLLKKDKSLDAEISIVSIPHMMVLPVFGLFRKRKSRKYVLEIRDLSWTYLDFKNSKFHMFAGKILGLICRIASKNFDYIVTTTQSQLDYFREFKINIEGKVVSNGLSLSKFQELKNLNLKEPLNKFNVLYAGSVGFPQNIFVLAEAAKLLNEYPEIQINIAGHGPQYEKIEEFIKKNALVNVKCLGSKDWEELKSLYENTHVLYAQLTDSPSFTKNQPSKIFEYAATGLPFIYGGKGESAKMLTKFENYSLITPDDPLMLKKTILDFYNNYPGKSLLNQEVIFSNYIREKNAVLYTDIINSI